MCTFPSIAAPDFNGVFEVIYRSLSLPFSFENYPVVYFVQIIRFDGRILFFVCLGFFLVGEGEGEGGGRVGWGVPSLVPFVQTADNSIQWINRYPADKLYSNQYILSAG